jgi:Protein of unknown function (DUF1566)
MRSPRLGSAALALIGSMLVACGEKDGTAAGATIDAGDWDPVLGRRDDAGASPRDGAVVDGVRVDAAADAEAQPAGDAGDAGSACACQNGGTCSGASATCTCPAGFTGALCADDIDECAATSAVCENPSFPCRNLRGGYTCAGSTIDWPIPRRRLANTDYGSEGLVVDAAAGTVLDDVTGLMWQRRAPTAFDPSLSVAAQACADLITGGFDDWRLPTVLELSSLHTTKVVPTFPLGLFESTPLTSWTSTPSGTNAVIVTSEPYLYGVPASTPDVASHLCVRTARDVAEGLPSARFDTTARDLVTDRRTKLMWQRTAAASTMTFAEATSYCDALVVGPYADFRLPSFPELLSTHELDGEAPHGGHVLIGPAEPYIAWFWTDTVQSRTEAPIRVDFVLTRWYFESDGQNAYVRCVRGAD